MESKLVMRLVMLVYVEEVRKRIQSIGDHSCSCLTAKKIGAQGEFGVEQAFQLQGG